MVVVITGPLHVGKTTVCERTLALLRPGGIEPAGILTPARFSAGGERAGLDVVDVASGTRRALAIGLCQMAALGLDLSPQQHAALDTYRHPAEGIPSPSTIHSEEPSPHA